MSARSINRWRRALAAAAVVALPFGMTACAEDEPADNNGEVVEGGDVDADVDVDAPEDVDAPDVDVPDVDVDADVEDSEDANDEAEEGN